MVGIVVSTIFINLPISAQFNKNYNIISKYHKWGIIAGPVLYKKAKLYPQFGNYSFDNKPIWGFNAGIEYDIAPERSWSFITGLILAYEPVYNLHYRIKKEDLYPVYTEDATGDVKMYANPSFSIPLLVRYNYLIRRNSFIYIVTGFKLMYFPNGEASLTLIFRNEDPSEAKEVFGLRLDSPDNSFQGSYVIGSGFAIALNNTFIKTTLLYVINFQNTIEGEYQFGNLAVSLPTRGDYKLSGNYLGLLFTVSFAKKKHHDN